MNKKFIVVLTAVCGLIAAGFVAAAFGDNVSGWAWSENIGWVSFNNTTGGGDASYGVHICDEADTHLLCNGLDKGTIVGYAWSENIGWIDFSQAELDLDTHKISGWARALSGGGTDTGGWDGWIKLEGFEGNGDPYIDDSNGDFHGWAWGGDPEGDLDEAVIGWLSFNCEEGGATGNNICATSPYKVTTSFSFYNPPTCSIELQNENGEEIHEINPIGQPNDTFYIYVGDSTDDVGISEVKFSSDNIQDGFPTGGWTDWFDWNVSSSTAGWVASPTSTKTWGFGEDGETYEVWAEIKDEAGLTASCSSTIAVNEPPISQITSPEEGWFNSNLTIAVSDTDWDGTIDTNSCQYKVISYEIPGDPTSAITTINWPGGAGSSNRTCNSTKLITVGEGKDCRYEGENTCEIRVRSRDDDGAWHIPSVETDSIKFYSIDWTSPEPGKLYITPTEGEQTYPIEAKQGVEYIYKANITDNLKITGCQIYIKGETPLTSMPAGCDTGCLATTTYAFNESGTFENNYVRCIDVAGNASSSEKITINVCSDECSSEGEKYHECDSDALKVKTCGYYDDDICLEWSDWSTEKDCDDDDTPCSYTGCSADNKKRIGDYTDGWCEDMGSGDASCKTEIKDCSEDCAQWCQDAECRDLSTELEAMPTFVIAEENVNLKATVSGTMAGTINYKFDCDIDPASGGGDCMADGDYSDCDCQADGIIATAYSIQDAINDGKCSSLCSYSAAEKYTAKIFIQRGTGSAEATTTVTVEENQAPWAEELKANVLDVPEYACEPLSAILSWKFRDSNSSDFQSYFKVQVATSLDFVADKIAEIEKDTSGEEPPIQDGKTDECSLSASEFGEFKYNDTYHWRVKVWDRYGTESDDWAISDFIVGKRYPCPDIKPTPEDPEPGEDIEFSSNDSKCYDEYGSEIPCEKFEWDFGDGTSTTTDATTTIHFYAEGDKTYDVTLRVFDSVDWNSTTKKIYVAPPRGWKWKEILPFWK